MNNEKIKQEFDIFLSKSPFKDLDKNSREYIGMYGAFMGGYILCQEFLVKEFEKHA